MKAAILGMINYFPFKKDPGSSKSRGNQFTTPFSFEGAVFQWSYTQDTGQKRGQLGLLVYSFASR